jgi:hypothetical protein
MAVSRPRGLVLTDAVRRHLREEIGKRSLSQPPNSLRGDLRPAAAVLDEAGVGQLACQLSQMLEGTGGVVTQVARHVVQVDLGEGGRRRGRLQHLFHAVQLGQLRNHVGGTGHSQRLARARETLALVPAGVGKRLLEVVRQALDLPAQVHVLQERIGQRPELVALLGGEGPPHALGRCHTGGHLLQELVEGRGPWEQVAVVLHEFLEAGVDRLTVLALLQHPVQRIKGVAQVSHLLGIE